MTHDGLQESLASYLRAGTPRVVWTNMPLGGSGAPRPDVFTLDFRFTKFRSDCYEVKRSRSDLLADLTAGKWQSYLPFSHATWFAFELGLARPDEIPAECGIMVHGPGGWRAARRAKPRVLETLPRALWLKLIMEGHATNVFGERKWPRTALEFKNADRERKLLGAEIAEALSRRRDARKNYDETTKRLERLEKERDVEIAERRRELERDAQYEREALDSAQLGLAAVLGMDVSDAAAPVTLPMLTKRLQDLRWKLALNGLDDALKILQVLSAIAAPPQDLRERSATARKGAIAQKAERLAAAASPAARAVGAVFSQLLEA